MRGRDRTVTDLERDCQSGDAGVRPPPLRIVRQAFAGHFYLITDYVF